VPDLDLVGRAGRLLAQPPTPASLLHRLRGGSLESAVGGRVVLVTGASSGIGRAAARRIAAAGGVVVLVARGREGLEETRAEIAAAGGEAHVHPCDLTDLDEVARMAAEVLDARGRVDVLVNNAGRSIRRSIDQSYDRMHDFQRTMQLNYFGAVRLVLALLPGMRARRCGHVVNVSSAGVQLGAPRFAAYVASKAALDAFSRCLAPEVAGDGVRLTTLHMPLVRTPMLAPTPMYRVFPALTPEQAGDLVCSAIARRPRRLAPSYGSLVELAYAVSPGSVERVANGAYRLLPESAGRDQDEAAADGDGGPAPPPAGRGASGRGTRVRRGPPSGRRRPPR
jgi:NAD(P)-dependent dehydrogenase (short-subunit alcohol dehydrogenase family)